jgi:hypothetical protein
MVDVACSQLHVSPSDFEYPILAAHLKSSQRMLRDFMNLFVIPSTM